jgi:hypothetical protein
LDSSAFDFTIDATPSNATVAVAMPKATPQPEIVAPAPVLAAQPIPAQP